MSIYPEPDSVLETKTVEINKSVFALTVYLRLNQQIQYMAFLKGLDGKLLREL